MPLKEGTAWTAGSSGLLLGQQASQINSNLNPCRLPGTDGEKVQNVKDQRDCMTYLAPFIIPGNFPGKSGTGVCLIRSSSSLEGTGDCSVVGTAFISQILELPKFSPLTNDTGCKLEG